MPLAQIRESTVTCEFSSLVNWGAFGRTDLKVWIQEAESTKYVICMDGNYTDVVG